MKTLAQFYEEVTGEPAAVDFLKEQLSFLRKYADGHGWQELDKQASEITHKYVELVLKGKWKNTKNQDVDSNHNPLE
jgi:hypothetical protein